ncbi:MAG: 23S rRNA (pseudouridine(1915)-N(3))-methyltransferase RlmH [Synechococcus sp. MED-G71]|nr:MAG: 23S rRNA (pseudouridine(1915)-N(3))-methyltransferase RlmH [Synechococcus sp. MED-G71]
MQPSRIRVLAIGKVKRPWLLDGIAFYAKRLPGLEVVELKDSTQAKEADAVRNARKPAERLVLLTEEGRKLDSLRFAEQLGDWASERVALVIGGADGHSPALRQEADALLSLSALTFPHELARLVLMEQLYRASTILQGGPYHRT